MRDDYYADKAYDSSTLTTLPLPENSKFDFTTRKLRKHPLRSFVATQCGEFLSVSYLQIIGLLNSNDDQVKKDIASPGHEMQPWQTMRNPKAVVNVITQLLWFFSVIGWGVVLIIVVVGLFKWPGLGDFSSIFLKIKTLLYFYLKNMIFPTILTTLYWLCKYIQRNVSIPDKNNIIFNRRKGTVIVPAKEESPTQEIPFEQFDPYLNHSAQSSGRVCYHLCLCHRYSEKWFSSPDEQEDEWGVYQLWEFWQQYMDVSKPLPDVPKMEPYRSRDPVTAAYDKKHNRPKDYWKNMDMEKAEKMQAASKKAAKQYPWGKTREQALTQGWQPSGIGEGDWQQNSQYSEQTY